MVEFFKDKQTPKGKIEKYQVERSFWESEDIMKRPPCPPNQLVEMEDEAIVQNVQKGVKSRFYNQWRYSVSKERGTHHFHTLLAKFIHE